jgi:hypothetical protein
MENEIAIYPTYKYIYTQFLSGNWERTERSCDVPELLGIGCYVPPISYGRLEEGIRRGKVPTKNLIQMIESNKFKIGSKPDGRVIWITYRDEQPVLRKSAPISEIENLDKSGEQLLL